MSSVNKSLEDPLVAVVVSFASTESVSFTAAGSSLTPTTVITIVAVSVPPFPSETV